jgi:hypothetical protein
MTSTTSIYREQGVDSPYYHKVPDEMWDNYHTIFLTSGQNEETIADLIDINPRLDFFFRPENFQPKTIFKSSPHVIITDTSELRLRQFYIEDYLETHLGWKDKKNPGLYSPYGYDVFLINDDVDFDPGWWEKPSVLGLELFSILDYRHWLEQNPGNG